MKYFDDLFYNTIRDYCYANYPRIEVKQGAGLLNNNCHYNAVDFAEKENAYVILCLLFYTNNSDVVIHFINKKYGIYIDNTLGVAGRTYEYRMIREVNLAEYEANNVDNIYSLLWNTKRFLNRQVNPVIRFLTKKKVV